MLRLEERDPEKIRFYLEGEKPDDNDEGKATVKNWNCCPSLVILAFCFWFFKPVAAAAAAEPWATGLSRLNAQEDTGACWLREAEHSQGWRVRGALALCWRRLGLTSFPSSKGVLLKAEKMIKPVAFYLMPVQVPGGQAGPQTVSAWPGTEHAP